MKFLIPFSTAGAMLIAAPAVAQTAPIPADGTMLQVVATGHASRIPDIATITAGVVTQASTASAALQANAARMQGVLAALKKAGIADRDIQTASIQLNPQYKYGDNQPPTITGYQASNSVSVKFRDVAKSGAILDALVSQGANQISGPDLSVDAQDAAMDEARTDAVRRARARADLYAKAAGLSVARILSIDEGADTSPSRPVPMMAMRANAAPKTQISAGEQDITATITVRFLLK